MKGQTDPEPSGVPGEDWWSTGVVARPRRDRRGPDGAPYAPPQNPNGVEEYNKIPGVLESGT